jgi:hypothetical protein
MSRPAVTRRDVVLPTAANNAVSVVGMRRSGKTTYPWQPEVEFLASVVGEGEALIQARAELDNRATVDHEIRALLAVAEGNARARRDLITRAPQAARGFPHPRGFVGR